MTIRQEKLRFPSDEHEPHRLRVSFIEIERIGARIVAACIVASLARSERASFLRKAAMRRPTCSGMPLTRSTALPSMDTASVSPRKLPLC